MLRWTSPPDGVFSVVRLSNAFGPANAGERNVVCYFGFKYQMW
jgi:hypothetical protein